MNGTCTLLESNTNHPTVGLDLKSSYNKHFLPFNALCMLLSLNLFFYSFATVSKKVSMSTL